jgi:hypothetical protein
MTLNLRPWTLDLPCIPANLHTSLFPRSLLWLFNLNKAIKGQYTNY